MGQAQLKLELDLSSILLRFVAKRDIFAKVLAPKLHLSITVQVGVQRTTISKQSWQDKNSGILCSLEFFFEREVKLAEEGL